MTLFVLAGLASTTGAQSLVRLQGPGGRQINGGVHVAAVTQDERYLLCNVSDEYIPGDNNGFGDVAWYDLWTGTYSVAVTAAGGVPPDQDCWGVAVSADNRFIVFMSDATNLGPVHQNDMTDVFLWDGQTATVARVSLTSSGAEPADFSVGHEASDDGRFVLFSSESTDILPGDTNASEDLFLRDMLAGTTELVSVNFNGAFADNRTGGGELSGDGRYVAFMSQASDLVAGDNNGVEDLFIRDRQLSTTTRAVMGLGGAEPNNQSNWLSMTSSGDFIAFDSNATNLVAPPVGAWEVYLLERTSGSISLVSKGLGGQVANGASLRPRISDDSGWVLFCSDASNLISNDFDTEPDSFKIDLATGVIELVSRSTGGSQGQAPPGFGVYLDGGVMSLTGRYSVFYTNLAGLVAGDTNSGGDTFLWNDASGAGPIESYCTAKVNSLGCTPRLTSSGEPRDSGPEDAFFISTHGLRNNKPGLLLWSLTPAALPFSGGTLCLGEPVVRSPGGSSAGSSAGDDCSGTASFHFTQAYRHLHGLTNGTTAYAQYGGRDPGFLPPNAVTLSDGLVFTVGP